MKRADDDDDDDEGPVDEVAMAASLGRLDEQGNPGLDFTRVDAVRSLLTRALDQIEGPSAPTKRGGR
jgi:hypothetical protein